MNEEKRLQRHQRLMDNKAYQTMEGLTRYMDRYYLDYREMDSQGHFSRLSTCNRLLQGTRLQVNFQGWFQVLEE